MRNPVVTDVRVQEYEIAERHLFRKYGLEYRSHYFKLEEPVLRARVIEAGSGPPVLFIHGEGSLSSAWAPLLAELKGFQVLAVDLPGCGLTGGFNYRRCRNFRGHAVLFLSGILDSLQLRTVPIVASSMGGLWSFWLALKIRERVSAIVQLGCPSLILDTSAPFSRRLLSVRGLNSFLSAFQRPAVKTVKNMFKAMGHRQEAIERLPGEYWECMFRSAMLPDHQKGWLTVGECMLRLTGAARGLSLREGELRQVKQPTFFVWGDNDVFGQPDVGRRAARVMPGAKLQVIPGGHLPWLDKPARCGQSVREFLSGR